jgi:hypothetical protein
MGVVSIFSILLEREEAGTGEERVERSRSCAKEEGDLMMDSPCAAREEGDMNGHKIWKG